MRRPLPSLLVFAALSGACAPLPDAPTARGHRAGPGLEPPPTADGRATPAACVSPTNAQTCGLGACTVTVRACRGNLPLPCAPDDNRRAPEVCDGVDNDCDGAVDNAPGSSAERSICGRRAEPACRAPGEVTLAAGRHAVTLPVAPADACPLPYTMGGAVTWHDVVLVRVPTRSAVALASPGGGVRLMAAGQDGVRVVLATSRGLCGDGVARGASVLDPGVYALVGEVDAPSLPLAVEAEVLAVPAVTPQVELPTPAHTAMSTATQANGPFDCARHEGVDARVLHLCPGAPRRLTLSSPQGLVAALESVHAARTCLNVPADRGLTVALPDDALVLVRAWPYAQARGVASLDLQ